MAKPCSGPGRLPWQKNLPFLPPRSNKSRGWFPIFFNPVVLFKGRVFPQLFFLERRGRWKERTWKPPLEKGAQPISVAASIHFPLALGQAKEAWQAQVGPRTKWACREKTMVKTIYCFSRWGYLVADLWTLGPFWPKKPRFAVLEPRKG